MLAKQAIFNVNEPFQQDKKTVEIEGDICENPDEWPLVGSLRNGSEVESPDFIKGARLILRYERNESGKVIDIKNGTQIIVKFIVETDGKTSNIEIDKSCGNHSVDSLAINRAKSFSFIPAKFKGHYVRVRYSAPFYVYPTTARIDERLVSRTAEYEYYSTLYPIKFVFRNDTMTAEGKYKAANEAFLICYERNIDGWKDRDYIRLKKLGNDLLMRSADNNYAPAQEQIGYQTIFQNAPNPNDQIAIKYLEKLAERNDSWSVDPMLYLQKNYLVGAVDENNLYRNGQETSGRARFVGPKDLKKSRYYLEKIMSNETALKAYYGGGGLSGVKGAERDLNDLNKLIGDRAVKDLSNGIAKSIIGRWKMNLYDGITSYYTFKTDGTFRATHTYSEPAIWGVSITFDVVGTWQLTDSYGIKIHVTERGLNPRAKLITAGPVQKKFINDWNRGSNDEKVLATAELVRSAPGNLNYIGWLHDNVFVNPKYANGKITATYSTWTHSRDVTLVKIVPKKR